MNRIILSGRVVRITEKKDFSPNGSCVFIRLSVKKRGSKYEYYDISTWNTTADFIEKYVKMNDYILVEGRISLKEYFDEASNSYVKNFYITGTNVEFIGGKPDNKEVDEFTDKFVDGMKEEVLYDGIEDDILQ